MLHGMFDRVFVRGCVYVFVGALVFAACSGAGDGEEDAGQKPEPTPAALEPAWTATAPENQTGEGDLYLTGDDRVLYVRPESVAAYDGGSGDREWQRRVPNACTISEPNDAGDIAVTLGKKCRDVAVVDGKTGKQRWRTHISPVSSRYDSGDVVARIGDRSVTVIQFCSQVTRLSLRDGKRLGILAPQDRACANEADSDGQLIALWHDPETDDTPDDHGTGWIPSWEGKAAFELYDADTGKRLWRRAVDREAGGLETGAVVNSDPVILALTDEHHTTMRKYRRTSPKPGRYVGRQLPSTGDAFQRLGVADNVMVGMYTGSSGANGDGQRVFAFDLESGRELWSRSYPNAVGAAVAGLDENGVVVTHGEADSDDEGEITYKTWVARWDLRTGEDAGLVGRIDETGESYGSSVWEVKDGVLYAAGADLRAYELPEPDPEQGLPVAADWAEEDVRPDPLLEACAEIRPATLRKLGLRHSVELPAPANCTWVEHGQPEYSARGLQVNVTIAEPEDVPDVLEDEGKTAVENARELVKEQVEVPDDGFGLHVTSAMHHPPVPDPKPLDGVGDEAYGSSGTLAYGSNGAPTGSYLIVRERNVVVEVAAEGNYRVAYRGAGPPSLHDSETGVVAAAQDVFDALELDVSLPEPPADQGRFARVGDVCGALDDDATALGLKASPRIMPSGSDPRVASCAWSADADLADEVHVHAYAAAPSALTGETSKEVAKRIFQTSGRSNPRLKGIGDEARIYRDDDTWESEGYANSDRDVFVRKGNLVVQVAYTHWGEGAGDRVERDAVRMARKALRSAT